MKVLLIVVLILFIIALLPLTLRAKLDYIIDVNSGVLCIYLFRLKVFVARVYLEKNKVIVQTKRKRHEVILSNLRSGKDYKSKFIKNLLCNIKYNNVRLHSSVGLDNAMYSAITCGVLNMACGGAFMFFKDKLNIKNYSFSFMPKFLSIGAVVALSSSITFSLMLIIYVLMSSI